MEGAKPDIGSVRALVEGVEQQHSADPRVADAFSRQVRRELALPTADTSYAPIREALINAGAEDLIHRVLAILDAVAN